MAANFIAYRRLPGRNADSRPAAIADNASFADKGACYLAKIFFRGLLAVTRMVVRGFILAGLYGFGLLLRCGILRTRYVRFFVDVRMALGLHRSRFSCWRGRRVGGSGFRRLALIRIGRLCA